jgi:hypothetical protein
MFLEHVRTEILCATSFVEMVLLLLAGCRSSILSSLSFFGIPFLEQVISMAWDGQSG